MDIQKSKGSAVTILITVEYQFSNNTTTTNDSILQEIGEIVTESHKTEDNVFRARDEGGRAAERDDGSSQRGDEEERTAEKKVNGGDNDGNRDGPAGAARSGE